MFWMLIFTDAPLFFAHMWKKRWFRVFFLDLDLIDGGIDLPPVTWGLPKWGSKWMKLPSAE